MKGNNNLNVCFVSKYAMYHRCKLLESLKLPLENALIVLEFDDGKDVGTLDVGVMDKCQIYPSLQTTSAAYIMWGQDVYHGKLFHGKDVEIFHSRPTWCNYWPLAWLIITLMGHGE